MKPVVFGPGEGETISDRAERNVVVKCDHELVDVTWTRYDRVSAGPNRTCTSAMRTPGTCSRAS